jgi:hypothetical protein
MVLVVLALAGILGFAAIAMDGGLAYFDRRGAQNAADTAAMAASLAYTAGGDWQATAINRAASNGYATDGTDTEVSVFHPPVSGTYAGDDEAIQIVITSTVRTAFAHLVFGEPLRNTVEAVARAKEQRNIAGEVALFGANPNDCRTIWFAGTQSTNINGGGIFSNSTSSGDCPSGEQNGSGDVTVTGGGIDVAGTFRIIGGSGSVSPAPNELVPQRDLADVPLPDCSGWPDWGGKTINKPTTLEPGNYTRISISGNVIVYMNPGMYCITGLQGFTTQGGGKLISINTGDIGGVMIYMQRGPFDIAGGTEVHLQAPENLVDASGQQWAGMLVYADPRNTSDIGIRGNSGTTYTGTIYARSADCELAGTGDTIGISSQVVCNSVKLAGTAALTLTYEASQNYWMPQTVELTQ